MIDLQRKHELVPGDKETWTLEEILIYFIDNRYSWRFSQIVLDGIYLQLKHRLLE